MLTLCVAGGLQVGVAETCPELDEELVTLLSHEFDCTKFYYCVHGKPVEYKCPIGLHFNSELKVCDWPQNAGCEHGEEAEKEETGKT
ncbi:peritrophin-1-like [Arctopsyche grandis]|uniref:peritrophin-1-like n=1 Tax=Arctopsyche grandis TaxID=121162 RepID=UPI00406D7C87